MDRHRKAKVVSSYADDFVTLCQGPAAEALAVARRWMQALKLTLKETKTRTCDATQEHFDFPRLYLRPDGARADGSDLRGGSAVTAVRGPSAGTGTGHIISRNQAPWPEVVR